MKCKLITLCLLATCTLVAAPEEAKQYTGPLYPHPTTQPMPISIVVESYTMDGMTHYRSVVSSSLFTASSFAPVKWTPEQITGSSIGYRGKFFPDVQWTMSLWEPESFLPNLSDISMKGYAEALKQKYGEHITILNDESYRTGAIRVVFNRETRTLGYDIYDPSTDTTSRHYDSFVLFKGHLIEFSISGPVDEVDSQLDWYSILPRNLSLHTDDEDYESEVSSAYSEPEPEEEAAS